MSMFSAGIIGIEAGWDDDNARAKANVFFNDMKGKVAELQTTFATAFQAVSGATGHPGSSGGGNGPQSGGSGAGNTSAFSTLTTSANNYASVLRSAASAVGQTASALVQAQANAASALNTYAQRIGSAGMNQLPGTPGAGGGGGGANPYFTFGSWNAATQQNTPLSFNPATNQFFNSNNGMGMAGVGWPGGQGQRGNGQQQQRGMGANWWLRRGGILAAYQAYSAIKSNNAMEVAQRWGGIDDQISAAQSAGSSNPFETFALALGTDNPGQGLPGQGRITTGEGYVTGASNRAKQASATQKSLAAWVSERMSIRDDETGTREQTDITSTRNELLKQQLGATSKSNQTMREIERRRMELVVEVAEASPENRSAAQTKLAGYMKEIPGMQQAAANLESAELGRISYLNTGEIGASKLELETAQGKSSYIGNSLAMRLFENKQATEKDVQEMTVKGVDPEIIKNRRLTGKADDQFLRDESVYSEGVEASSIAGQSNVLDARVGRNPFQAEIRSHKAEADMALAKAKADGYDVSGYSTPGIFSGVGYEIRRRQGLQDEISDQNQTYELTRRDTQLTGQIAQLGFLVAHDPLNAQLSRNWGQAASETDAENQNPNAPGHMNRVLQILQRTNLQNQLDTDKWNFATGQIDLSQGTSIRQLNILKANPFDVVGARLAGIQGQAELNANNFVFEGRQKEAANEYKKAILQAEVEKADYLKSFGFTGIDPRYIGGSTDETANPGKVLKEISDTIAGLGKILADGLADGFKQVVDQGS